jgi:hypothetical protein
MDYEIDGAMRPEVRESHAGQRLGEKVSSWHGLGLGRIRVTQIVQLEFCEINQCKEVEEGHVVEIISHLYKADHVQPERHLLFRYLEFGH